MSLDERQGLYSWPKVSIEQFEILTKNLGKPKFVEKERIDGRLYLHKVWQDEEGVVVLESLVRIRKTRPAHFLVNIDPRRKEVQ